jgi:DNA-binding transcriptional ArsR family regulator
MANKNKITILNEKEKELLRATNSVIAYDLYFHLKDDDSYFKGEFYDLRRCIADYLNIPERTVKDVLKRLKDVGLVQTRKQGKVNLYTLPYNKKQNIKDYDREKETDDSGRNEEVSEGHKGQNTQGGGSKGEENKTVQPTPFQKENKPTDEEILRWIKDGYKEDYILKNWKELRLKETA